MFTVLLLLRTALRMRVSMSAMGSVEGIALSWFLCRCLPARLAHPGDLALERQLPQHDPADPELAIDAARTPRQLAPADNPRAELGRAQTLGHLGFGGHDACRLVAASSGLANGNPICSSTKRLSSGVEFRKVRLMFMPWVNTTSAMLISGNTPCSFTPIA